MAAQHPKLASNSLEKIPDNIAVSFLPDFELLSKKALEKGLNYFTTIWLSTYIFIPPLHNRGIVRQFFSDTESD
jgi:hypothetical protein